MAVQRKSYNTTLRTDLAKKLRILAAQTEKRQNDLLDLPALGHVARHRDDAELTVGGAVGGGVGLEPAEVAVAIAEPSETSQRAAFVELGDRAAFDLLEP